MSLGKLPRSMAFTTSASASTAQSLSGDTALRSSTTCPFLPLLMERWDALSSIPLDFDDSDKHTKFTDMQTFFLLVLLL